MPGLPNLAWVGPENAIGVLGVLGVLGALCLVVLVTEQRRQSAQRRALERTAADLGLRYQEKGSIAGESFFELPLFQHAEPHGLVQNLACNGDLLLFDFAHRVPGDEESLVRQTVVAHRLRGQPLPVFALRPEREGTSINEWLGASDIDFDDDPAFAKRFQLAGKDETALREVFHWDVREDFAESRGWCVEGGRHWVLFHRRGKRVRPRDLPEFVARTRRLARMLAR